MNKNDRMDFSKALTVAAEVFDRQMSAMCLAAYWEALVDLPLMDVLAGIARAVKEVKYMPRPSEIRSLAGAKTPKQVAECAWTRLLDVVSLHGPMAPAHLDPATAATVAKIGGLWKIRMSTFQQHESLKRSFIDMYSGSALEIASPPKKKLIPKKVSGST